MTGVGMTILSTFLVIASLVAFPSVTVWVIAFWLAWHTMSAMYDRPAWLPLATCLIVLCVKLVPRTPAMVVMGCLLALVAGFRWSHLREQKRLAEDDQALTSRQRRKPKMVWWRGAFILWLVWGWVAFEHWSIVNCGRPLTLDSSRPVVCIGDSLTQGLLPDHGYPDQLKSMLGVPVVNLGFSGISTSQGLGQMDRVLGHNPQVVVIELGGHDFLKGHSRAQTKQNLTEMILKCRSNRVDVVLMEIPRGFIFDPFANLEREIAFERDVQLVEDSWLREVVIMSPIAPPGKWMPDAHLSDDGIHSNPRGSRAIAKRVAAALQRMYGDRILATASQVSESTSGQSIDVNHEAHTASPVQ